MEKALIAGRYELLGLLGSGGEAEVFRALDLREGKEVAVRLPRQAGAQVQRAPELAFHPAWVRLLDSGPEPGRGAYQVFELLEGETLQQKMKHGPMENGAWLDFILETLDAVEALHAAGFVHGDLNAENLFAVTAPPSWKLLELPFLRLSGAQEHSALFGSIHTLSPELFQGHAAAAGSDLYALGCLYYYAAAGEFPHVGGTRQEVVISLLRFAPVPLAEKCPDRPAAITAWLMNLLERDLKRRCGTVAEARRTFEAAL